jgi:hypothetical protein
MNSDGKGYKGKRTFMVGFRPVVRAREGRMLGIRQPLDGPIFEKLEHAQYWCWYAMLDHCRIEPFNGLVYCR